MKCSMYFHMHATWTDSLSDDLEMTQSDGITDSTLMPCLFIVSTNFDELSNRSKNATLKVTLDDGTTKDLAMDAALLPENSRQVGVDLVSRYPAGLEIAGVVLLMALFGAVILARKQIELGEDERRGIAGMRRLTVDGEAGGSR